MRGKMKVEMFAGMVLSAFHALNIAFWFGRGFWPMGKDWHVHLSNAFFLARAVEQNFWPAFFCAPNCYPPFYYWIAVGLRNLFGTHYIFLASAVFFFLLLFSVGRIGYLLKNQDTAFLAMIICSFYPVLYHQTKQFTLDLAAAAMVTLTCLLLVCAKGFQSLGISAVCGIVMGLTVLTREFSLIFIIGPLAIAFYFGIRNGGCEPVVPRRKRFINLIVSVAIALGISGFYYFDQRYLQSIFLRMGMKGAAGGGTVLAWPHLSYYLGILPQQLGWGGMIAALFGIYRLRKEPVFNVMFLSAWILLPLIALSLTRAKFSEYSLAYLPGLAVITALGIENIVRGRWKKIIALLLVVVNICFYLKEF